MVAAGGAVELAAREPGGTPGVVAGEVPGEDAAGDAAGDVAAGLEGRGEDRECVRVMAWLLKEEMIKMKKIIVVVALAVLFMLVPKAEAGVLDYIDPQLGSGWEFIELKGPVVIGSARAFQGKDKIDWLSIRIGGLLNDDIKPGLIGGPFVDLTLVTRGKLDFILNYAQADFGLFGGVLYSPGEEEAKLLPLFGIAVVLVSR